MKLRLPERVDRAARIQRRDYLQQRGVQLFMRVCLVLSPISIILVVALDLLCRIRPVWMQGLFASLLLIHLFNLRRSIGYRRQGPLSPVTTRRAYADSVVVCGLMGCLWTATVLAACSLPDPVLQGLLVLSMICGGILLTPVRGGSLLYIVVVMIGAVLSVRGHGAAGEQIRIMIAGYGLAAVALVLWKHSEFCRMADNEMKLQEQAEIIGILLHEVEEQGSDWLWETDSELRLCPPSHRLLSVLGCNNRALADLSLRRWIGARLRHASNGQEGFATLADCIDSRLPFRGVRIPVGPRDRERWLLVTGKPVLNPDGSFRGYRGVGSDITDALQSEKQVAWLARHDSLTGLPNRAHFHEVLEQAFSVQCAAGQTIAVLCLDLDGFKAVNDSLGHMAGDSLLAQVAGRLHGCIRDHDRIGRLGGDEFALLLLDGDRAGAERLAKRLRDRIAEPFLLDGQTVGIGISIGVMLWPDDAPEDRPIDAQELLRGADLAMYCAKRQGRGSVCFYEPTLQDSAQDRLLLQADLRHAIARGQLLLHFQPIMHSITGRVVSAEALVRWIHPTRGLIPPSDFIPVAEESGLIGELGAWVLHRACNEATQWSDEIGVSVNLSAIQLRDPALISIVESGLLSSGLSPERLELEITESLFVESNTIVRDNLRRLKQRGIRIALDDFGTGFSSLSYLRQFPVDTVKIDRSFVRDLGCDLEADMIVQAIAGMANGLGITITAEGVETIDQAARLRASGCSQFQGFLYSRPCDADTVRRFIASQNIQAAPLLFHPEQEPLVAARGSRLETASGQVESLCDSA